MFKILKRKTWKEVQESEGFLQRKVYELGHKWQQLRIKNKNLEEYIYLLETKITEYISNSFPKNLIKYDLNTTITEDLTHPDFLQYIIRLNPVHLSNRFRMTDGDVIKELLFDDEYFDYVAEQIMNVAKDDLVKELKETFVNEARKDPKIAKIIGRANTELY